MPFLDPPELRRRLDRHGAWYRHQLADGPLVSMTIRPTPADAARVEAKHRPPADDVNRLVVWWTDPDLVVPRLIDGWKIRTLLGDAFPYHYVNLGPGSLAAYLGCRSVPQATTIWQEPLINDWSAAPAICLHEDNLYWRATQELTRASLQAAGGRWLTSMTDIGGALDIVSYLRTPEMLCLDLLDHPAEVKRCEEAVIDAWLQAYDRLHPLIVADAGGVGSWMGSWYPGREAALQCDFSCMISTALFREFALPSLHRLAASLDVAVYHLDGPNAIRHLDAICEVSHIRAIQWVPGAGNSWRVADWLDLYRRILDLGRGIWMWCESDELDLIFDRLDPSLLFLNMAADDLASGRKIMAQIDRLRRGRKRIQ